MPCTYAHDRKPEGPAQNAGENTLLAPEPAPGTFLPHEGLPPSPETALSVPSSNLAPRPTQSLSAGSPSGYSGPTPPSCPSAEGPEKLDFSNLDLVCPIKADDISNRWLQSFMPVPGQKSKEYPASITAFIYRILKSYAAKTIRGRGLPPFVHSCQATADAAKPPLSVCLGLVRMCDNPLPGSESAAMDVLQREMVTLYEQHASYDNLTLLSAFQAYLIYSLVLFFSLGAGATSFLREAMMNLQELACSSSRQGLVCEAEQRRARPTWEAWIVAEAKRRTLFAMYLFDSVLLTQDGLPTFLGTELHGLLVPTGKALWSAENRNDWEMAYNVHLADWGGSALTIDELWPMEASVDEHEVFQRRKRVDRWLECVDEFGMMIYAVTSCTHGG